MNGIRSALVDAVIAALPIAIVFFSGWAYLSSYLGEFGVDATEVTIPLPTVLVYAFSPLKSPGVLVFLGICVALWVTFECYSSSKNEYRDQIVLVASLIGLTLLLFVIRAAAQSDAKAQANFVWTGHKALSVPTLIEPHQGEAYDAFVQCRDRRGLRQILGLSDRMYVLCRDKYYSCARGRMYVISTGGAILYSSLLSREPEMEENCEN